MRSSSRRRGYYRAFQFLIVLIASTAFVVSSGARPALQTGLPDGPGKAETQKVCAGCHEIEKSLSLRQDRAGWHKTIEKMVSLGAKATDQEFNAVLEYLTRHFPADSLPLINVNAATAIELESGLSLKRSQAAAIIKHRDKIGKFTGIEDLKKVPGIDVGHIEARKHRITF